MGDKLSDLMHAKAVNIARKQRRTEMRPQVAATIYAGYLSHPLFCESPRGQLMDNAIIDADILLSKLFPVLPEVDPENEHT